MFLGSNGTGFSIAFKLNLESNKYFSVFSLLVADIPGKLK
jgi:hypothetical protein